MEVDGKDDSGTAGTAGHISLHSSSPSYNSHIPHQVSVHSGASIVAHQVALKAKPREVILTTPFGTFHRMPLDLWSISAGAQRNCDAEDGDGVEHQSPIDVSHDDVVAAFSCYHRNDRYDDQSPDNVPSTTSRKENARRSSTNEDLSDELKTKVRQFHSYSLYRCFTIFLLRY